MTGMTESVIDALIAYFTTRLPAVLDEITAEREDADTARGEVVSLAQPDLYLFGTRERDPNVYPSLVFADEGSVSLDVGPTIGTGSASAQGWAEMEHTISVTCWLASSDEQTVSRQMARFKRAIWRVLTESQVIPGESPYLIQPQRAESQLEGGPVRSHTWFVRIGSLEEF